MAPDPFDLLGLPPTFDLDRAAIDRAYLSRAAAVHPDLAAGDPEAPRRSALLNRARSILSDPESRAAALLARLGGPSKESDRSLPDGFLAEILEVREEIEAAARSTDHAARARWEAWADERRAAHIAEISRLFAAPDAPPLRAIRMELNAWRYVERLIEQLDTAGEAPRAGPSN